MRARVSFFFFFIPWLELNHGNLSSVHFKEDLPWRQESLGILQMTKLYLLPFFLFLTFYMLCFWNKSIHFHYSKNYSPNKIFSDPHGTGKGVLFPHWAFCKLETYQRWLSENSLQTVFLSAKPSNSSFKKTLTECNALQMSLGACNGINLFVLWYFTVSHVRDVHFIFFPICSFR